MKDRKVFCKDCAHHSRAQSVGGWERCGSKRMTRPDYVTGGLITEGDFELPYLKNNKGTCPDYKRKWWKVWAKK